MFEINSFCRSLKVRNSFQQMDKTGKAFQYLDAALSFVEYGMALESNAVAPKPAYSIFADTIDLLK